MVATSVRSDSDESQKFMGNAPSSFTWDEIRRRKIKIIRLTNDHSRHQITPICDKYEYHRYNPENCDQENHDSYHSPIRQMAFII